MPDFTETLFSQWIILTERLWIRFVFKTMEWRENGREVI